MFSLCVQLLWARAGQRAPQKRFLSENAQLGKKIVFCGHTLTTETRNQPHNEEPNPGASVTHVPGSQSQGCVLGSDSLGLPSSWLQTPPEVLCQQPSPMVAPDARASSCFSFSLKAGSTGSLAALPFMTQSRGTLLSRSFYPCLRALCHLGALCPLRADTWRAQNPSAILRSIPGCCSIPLPWSRVIHPACAQCGWFAGGMERVGSLFLTLLFWSLWLLVQEHCCYFQCCSCCWSWPLLLWFLFPAALLRWTISSISSSGRPPLLPLACRNFFCLVWYF